MFNALAWSASIGLTWFMFSCVLWFNILEILWMLDTDDQRLMFLIAWFVTPFIGGFIFGWRRI